MTTEIMNYSTGQAEYKNWCVAEERFDSQFLGKAEAIFSLGNGYMGARSTTEERYVGEVRNTFVAGTFNRFAENEVTELPNVADVIAMEFFLNGSRFDLTLGKIHHYKRQLDLKRAELVREVDWEAPTGERYVLEFRRFISLADRHLVGQRITITPLQEASLRVISGINGQVTNSGVQHFIEGEKRLYEEVYLQQVQKTTESKIDFVLNTTHRFMKQDTPVQVKGLIQMDRRKIVYDFKQIALQANEPFVIEKLSTIHTSRDNDQRQADYTLESLREESLTELKEAAAAGYEAKFHQHSVEWNQHIWSALDIEIEGDDGFDQLAIRFAQYHMTVMTPAHDHRMNIGAKGLSGEGYKGHTFWDTEIFLLPYFIYTQPKVAKSLLEYRYQTLPGAHRKALENGYEGAMFPWESAWLEDGEVTPVYGAADIVTGTATKIWSGFIEQHITSDVAFATWQYYQITGDETFMEESGYELILDTAKFWASRLEWNDAAKQYYINQVIGPDEYKEHVNNNAFTNYTAHWNIQKAMEYKTALEQTKPALYARLDEKMNLAKAFAKWEECLPLLYLPAVREDGVLPQDDTYLSKEIIDLTKYKEQTHVGSLFEDYNLEQVNEIQVSKQADVMILFYLLEDLFDQKTKQANWSYYEPKTLHDSSLSLSTHCVLASDMGETDLAYDLFSRAARIDLGPNMKTSDHGIHAASLGGIWQSVVNGFGGVRMLNGQLRINPRLPKAWDRLAFPIHWQGERLECTVTRDMLDIKQVTGGQPVSFTHAGNLHTIEREIQLPLQQQVSETR